MGLVEAASRASSSKPPDGADWEHVFLPNDAVPPVLTIESISQRVSVLGPLLNRYVLHADFR